MKKWIALVVAHFIFYPLQAQPIRIGLMADCQYCNCDYSEKWQNDYKQGLPRLQEAVDTFNTEQVDLTLHLGDFIDRDFVSFKAVTPIFEQLQMPHYHVLGNHDFSVKSTHKAKVATALGLEHPYYLLHKKDWTFIILDGTDISLYKYSDSTKIQEADSIRLSYLHQGRTQAMPWNGAISSNQLSWLEQHLALADSAKQKVIVFCHFPILPKGNANLWNDIELVQIMESHYSVKAFINGHHHPGNYVNHNEVHYLTLQGMVRGKEQNAFSILSLSGDEITVRGYGRSVNRVLTIR